MFAYTLDDLVASVAVHLTVAVPIHNQASSGLQNPAAETIPRPVSCHKTLITKKIKQKLVPIFLFKYLLKQFCYFISFKNFGVREKLFQSWLLIKCRSTVSYITLLMTLFFHFLYFILNKLRKCIAERPMMSLPVHNKPFYFSEEGFLIDPMHGLSYSDKIHATIGKRLQPLTLTGHKRQVT